MHDILEVMILNSDLDFENSEVKVYFFAKFSLKKLKLSVLFENGTHDILDELISNLDLDFQNSDPKTYIWTNWPETLKVVRFLLVFFRTSNLQSIFGQIWDEKVKVVRLAQKLANLIPRKFLPQKIENEKRRSKNPNTNCCRKIQIENTCTSSALRKVWHSAKWC